MIAEIRIKVGFCRYKAPANENCEKCSFYCTSLCSKEIKGLHEQCGYGIRGYWIFNDLPIGSVHE